MSEVVALIPLRGSGKSRLGRSLGPAQRGRLVAAMLDDVITALREGGVADVRVLVADGTARDVAVARGLTVVEDPSPDPRGDRARSGTEPRLCAAVDAALAAVPYDRVRLVVAADLPRLRGTDVAAVLGAGVDVAVAPTTGGGTALLALGPGVVIPARYGAGSAGAHLDEARRLGRSAVRVELPGARLDVDAADDLEALRHDAGPPPPGAATSAFLADLHR